MVNKGDIAPPPSLPLRHFVGAAAAFLVFAAGLTAGASRLVGFGFEPRFALGLVHVLTMGWIAQTILGAWCQMIPVHGGRALVLERGLGAGWWMFAAGLAGFVGALWSGSDRYWIPAALVYSGLLSELIPLAATLASAPRRDWPGAHFAAAFFWLVALGAAGLLMAVDRHRAIVFRDPEGGLVAHVHMALIGFGTMTIYGAGYRLFPWVGLHAMRSKLEGRLAFALLQAGLVGMAADALFFGRRLMPLWAVLLGGSYAAYFSQLRPLAAETAAFDPPVAALLLGIAGGGLWAALGVALACGFLTDTVAARSAYVYSALVGFFTPIILAQSRKIATVLVWRHVYGPRDGKPPLSTPTFEDLSRRRQAWVETGALLAALPLGVAGFLWEDERLVAAAGLALLVCAVVYTAHVASLLSRLVRR